MAASMADLSAPRRAVLKVVSLAAQMDSYLVGLWVALMVGQWVVQMAGKLDDLMAASTAVGSGKRMVVR
jgi:hypothetical protein